MSLSLWEDLEGFSPQCLIVCCADAARVDRKLSMARAAQKRATCNFVPACKDFRSSEIIAISESVTLITPQSLHRPRTHWGPRLRVRPRTRALTRTPQAIFTTLSRGGRQPLPPGECGVGALPTRIYKPRDKAKIETGVQVAERWIVSAPRHRKFFSPSSI